MIQQAVPDDIVVLAQERASARAAGDWSTADDLKGRIEASDWRIVDDGVAFDLSPARLPDLIEDGQTFYGAAESIPSRLDEAASCPATVIVAVGPDSPLVDEVLSALQMHAVPETQVVVVADRGTVIAPGEYEVIRSVDPFGPGEALQAGLRRAVGEVIVVLDPDRILEGDVIGPLRACLVEETVAIAGVEGLTSTDLRRYGPAQPGNVTALRSGCYAVRRSDVIAHVPLDTGLNLPGSLATWWSLELRDSGPDLPPRRAVAVELPLRVAGSGAPPEAHARLATRVAYLIATLVRGRDGLANG
jgi:hypothetical protein